MPTDTASDSTTPTRTRQRGGVEADDFVTRAHMHDFSGMRLAGLVRISHEVNHDEDEEEERRPGYRTGRDIAGREVQAEDCQGYIERRGGTYVHTYEEPDTSAYKQKRVILPDGSIVYRVVRPVFDKALADLKRGIGPDGSRLDGLIVYDIDRFTRDPRHLEDAIEVVVHYHHPIVDVTGSLDLLTDNGRTMARVIVATAHKQSADTARRVKRKARKMQQEGLPAGGPRTFGFNKDGRTEHPTEADTVRKAVKRIIDGAPLAAVVTDWNSNGIVTARGNRWTTQGAKQMLRNPKVCGLRGRQVNDVDPVTQSSSVNYEIVINTKTGEPVVGQWDALVSVPDWEKLMSILGSRRLGVRGKNTRKYLMSGILRCGIEGCGTRMAGSSRTGTDDYFRYRCPGKNAGGCGGVAIAGAETDRYLTEAILSKLELEAKRRKAQTPATVWQRENELADVREQIGDLTQAWRSKAIKAARYFAVLGDLEEEETALETERKEWYSRTSSVLPTAVNIRADWPSKTLAEQRAYAQSVLTAVIVKPPWGPRRFNPERLVPVWVEHDDA